MNPNPPSKMAMEISSPSSFSGVAPHSPTASGDASPRGVSAAFFSQASYPCHVSSSLQLPSCRQALPPSSLPVPDSLPLSPSSFKLLHSSSRPVDPSASLSSSLLTPCGSLPTPHSGSSSSASSRDNPPQSFSTRPQESRRPTGEELTRSLLATWAVSAKVSKKGEHGVEHRRKRSSKQSTRAGFGDHSSSSSSSVLLSHSSSSTVSSTLFFPSTSPATHPSESNDVRTSRSPVSPPSGSSFSSLSDSQFSSSWWSPETGAFQEDLSRLSVVQAVLSNQSRRDIWKRNDSENRSFCGTRKEHIGDGKSEMPTESRDFSRSHNASRPRKEGSSLFEKKEDGVKSGMFEFSTEQSGNSSSLFSSPRSTNPLASASPPPVTTSISSSVPIGGKCDSCAPTMDAEETQTNRCGKPEETSCPEQGITVSTSESEKERDVSELEGDRVVLDGKQEKRLCRDVNVSIVEHMEWRGCDKKERLNEARKVPMGRRDRRATNVHQEDFLGSGILPDVNDVADSGDEREGTVSRVLQILRCQSLLRDAEAALRASRHSLDVSNVLNITESSEREDKYMLEHLKDAGEEGEGGCTTITGTADDACSADGGNQRCGEERENAVWLDDTNCGKEETMLSEGEEGGEGTAMRKRSVWMCGEKSEWDLHDDLAVKSLRALLPSLLESCPEWIDEKLNIGRSTHL